MTVTPRIRAKAVSGAITTAGKEWAEGTDLTPPPIPLDHAMKALLREVGGEPDEDARRLERMLRHALTLSEKLARSHLETVEAAHGKEAEADARVDWIERSARELVALRSDLPWVADAANAYAEGRAVTWGRARAAYNEFVDAFAEGGDLRPAASALAAQLGRFSEPGEEPRAERLRDLLHSFAECGDPDNTEEAKAVLEQADLWAYPGLDPAAA